MTQAEFDAPDAGRVLARGRRPGRGRGARTRSCWPRRSGCSRATSSGRSACTASTTARSCTCSATRTARATGRLIRETLEFDPEILKRYVNFMSNPDEKTAVEQFGKGDKYFGVATVMATLPGLPMLGHGQVEGFAEKYGMEFRRATLDEQPDPWLVERHEREIFPLLHRRAWFAEAHDFLLYDFVTDGGGVDENVLAYSNGHGPDALARRLPHRFASTAGHDPRVGAVRAQVGRAARKRLVRRSLAEGLGLPGRPGGVRGLPRCADRARVPALVPRASGSAGCGWRSTRTRATSSGSSARSATGSPASGAGWPSGSAGAACRRSTTRSRELQLEPVHAPFRAMFDGRAGRGGPRRHGRRRRSRRARGAVGGVPRGGRRRRPVSTATRSRPAAAIRDEASAAYRGDAEATGRALTRAIGRPCSAGWCCPDSASWRRAPTWPRPSLAWYDELRLAPVVAAGFRAAGLDEATAWSVADLVRVLLALPRPSHDPRPRPAAPTCACSRRWLAPRPGPRGAWASTPGRASSGSTATGSRRCCAWARPAGRDRDRAATRHGARDAVPDGRRRRRATGSTSSGGPQRAESGSPKRRPKPCLSPADA